MPKNNYNIINLGVGPETTFAESRRIQLVNLSAFLAFATTLPYIFFFIPIDLRLGILTMFFSVCFTLTWLLNQKRKFFIAKIWLYLFSNLYLFTAASALGREAGEHLLLIPTLLSAVLAFDFQERKGLFSIIALTAASFIILEIYNYSFYTLEFSATYIRYLYFSSLSITLIGSATVALFYYFQFGKQLEENQEMLKMGLEIEQTINYFSTSLYGKNTVDEIFVGCGQKLYW